MSVFSVVRRHAKVAVFFLNVAALAAFWPFGPRPFFRSRGDCITNLRHYSAAMDAYLADNGYRYPDRDSWMTALTLYQPKGESPYCPAVADIEGAFGYAFNSALAGQRRGSGADGRTPLIFDSINMAVNASGPASTVPIPARHEGLNHILNVDGSVNRMSAPLEQP